METRPTIAEIAGMIDHALLHPTLTREAVESGLGLCLDYGVATACVKPCDVPLATRFLKGSATGVCTVIGFPHGSNATGIKIAEVEAALADGAVELDMVVNVGRVKAGDWEAVLHEIRAVNEAVTGGGAILKVIFENDFLNEKEIIRLCEISTEAEVAYIKTSTGFGFVKGSEGTYSYRGARPEHITLMREHSGPEIRLKAAGGIRGLDDLLAYRGMGVSRIGASGTKEIVAEAVARGFPGSAPETAGGEDASGEAGY
ncbi:MAG: deoxyribose-phosphate aldolase [Oceanipulchritudo sp.]